MIYSSDTKFALLAWRCSYVPIIGVPLYAILSVLSLYYIGKSGKTGIYYLERGIKICITINCLVIIIFLSWCFWPRNEIVRYDDKCFVTGSYNRSLKPYFDLQKHGKWQCFDSNGKLMWEGIYSNGKPIGQWTGYYPNGVKAWSGKYGLSTHFLLIMRLQRKAMELPQSHISFRLYETGKWEYWDNSGNLLRIVHYNYGRRGRTETIEYESETLKKEAGQTNVVTHD